MTELKALIVDDEPLAHQVLLTYCENFPFVTVVGQCYSATEALSFLAEHPVDLLFLDINMPMLSGLDLLRVLKTKPQVVITSAYQEYALESFELEVTDYLLKPFSFERCLQACNKALAQCQLIEQAKSQSQFTEKECETPAIFIKVDKKQIQLNLADISCLEAYGNYVKVWRDGKSLLTPRTLSSFEQQLPSEQFIKVHRSAIVNLDHIDYVEGTKVRLLDGHELNIGKSFKSSVSELLLTKHTVSGD